MKPTEDEIIAIHQFHKSFKHKKVHQGVSFSVHQSECVGLIGGSGTGKSVLLRSLIGLERPDSGEVFIHGTEVSRLREQDLIEVRKSVAYVFQDGALFDSMTVFENLAYPLREHFHLNENEIHPRVNDQLNEFGLPDAAPLYPANLSGGMQKRIGIARAVIMNPDVILYDEPTAGLDPFNTKKIQELILKLKNRGVTAILVTHDIPTALAVCDRLVFLKNGRIAAEDKIEDIEKNPESLIQKFIRGEA